MRDGSPKGDGSSEADSSSVTAGTSEGNRSSKSSGNRSSESSGNRSSDSSGNRFSGSSEGNGCSDGDRFTEDDSSVGII